MATFREITYMVLDLLKERSDDAFYTEEHVLFLLSKFRALLLERKYKGARNSTYNKMSSENLQQVCLSVSPAQLLPDGCAGDWLRSDQKIPEMITSYDGVTCTGHDLLPTVVTFIPKERMPYVGYNKWLKNFIYAAVSADGHLYLKGTNPQFLFLEHVGLTAAFSDIEGAAALSHEACENGGICDVMDQNFPLEEFLIPQCIEMVVQELAGPRYAPDDMNNDDRDNLAGLATRTRTSNPAGRHTEQIMQEEPQQ